MGFKFGTKAENLYQLYKCRKTIGAEVFFPHYFTVADWNEKRREIVEKIMEKEADAAELIVRSSASAEDARGFSMAGAYESRLCKNDSKDITDAVCCVIASYDIPDIKDQVLIQRAAQSVQMSGVMFSCNPLNGGAYYVINYDDTTGSTSSVTSGKTDRTKLYYHFKAREKKPENELLARCINVMEKMVELTGNDLLDIEFLFSEGEFFLLQVRPLNVKTEIVDTSEQLSVLRRIEKRILQNNQRKPFLFGRRTIYGIMPDWNPAEMIGIHPRNLATSIYKEVITDNVWAYQRDNYGYKELRSFPLMVDFAGYPYIDVRVSFNSFIPKGLDDTLAEKLVNYYLDMLESNPEKHDKVEFEIVFSCYTFDLAKRISVLKEYGFTESEIKQIVEALRTLTTSIIDNEKGLWRKDSLKMKVLEDRRNQIESSKLRDSEQIFWLIEDCKRYGTLPFAGLARAGFVAVQILKSMVSERIITEADYSAFMTNLETVASAMRRDYLRMDKEVFLNVYGFLRPGTYDIRSPRYDDASAVFFDWEDIRVKEKQQTDSFRLSLKQMEKIRDAMMFHGLGDDVLGLFSFIKGAIEGRELAKFIFTRSISDVLEKIAKYGEREGFSRDDLSFADIRIIRDIYMGTSDSREMVMRSIEAGKRKYREGVGITLPPLICNEDEVMSFFVPESTPTYVSQRRIQAGICTDIMGAGNDTLKGKIVLLESADPGYDWLLSHPISGFITKYGGANSHMAIRAQELDMPAVIGVGERLFPSLVSSRIVEIDAPNKRITIVG